MDFAAYSLLLLGALAGGFVSGLAGFGTGMMALGLWLYVLPPALAVPLVLICSVVAQSATLPSMWRSFDFTLMWPFIVGGLIGVPIGTVLIHDIDPTTFKLGFGIFLLIFPAILFLRRTPTRLKIGGRMADAGIGFAGGVLGGLAGLSGPLPILWASVRGWDKAERRGVFQTYNWTILFVALCMQAATGLIESKVLWLALLAFPATLIGTALGARVYHALNDRNFGDLVLVLLLISGLTLVWSNLPR